MRIKVSDNGVGMSENEVQNLFDIKVDNSSTNRMSTKGIGLGMSMAKKIIEKYNGSISCKSKPQQGTTFTFTFETQVVIQNERRLEAVNNVI